MLRKCLLGVLGFFLCSSAVFAQEIRIAAAANLQFVLQELKAEFEKDTQIKVQIITGSSGKLTAQIENGAPFDIFMSADMDYPDTIHSKNLSVEAPRIYAYGKLVLWSFKKVDLSKGLRILLEKDIKKVAIANPQTAPYGRQAMNALRYFGIDKDVEVKLVFGESIAQVNQFITSQAADIGITALSVVLAPNMQGKGTWKDVDFNSYAPIAQGVVILKYAKEHNLNEVKEFYNFLFSTKAKEIFEKYGYVAP